MKRPLTLLIPLLPVLALGVAVLAAPLEEGGTGRVVEIVDGDTLVLDDGRQVRLVGIQAPKLPLGRPGFEAWPLGDKAKAALEGLTLDRVVSLRYGGRQMDRHGRVLAHLFDEDGVWIQGALLDKGMVRVYSFADNRALGQPAVGEKRSMRPGTITWDIGEIMDQVIQRNYRYIEVLLVDLVLRSMV